MNAFKIVLLITCFAGILTKCYGILCYQCSAGKTIDCSDMMIHMGGIEPQSCDNVFEAQYCVKTTSLDDGIGAKRFCSSMDLGNYCNYVRQPGDILTYRSCVFTCSGDGCNTSPRSAIMSINVLIIANISIYLIHKCLR